jgi:hypothetical protein
MICNNFSLFTFLRILLDNRVLIWSLTYGTFYILLLFHPVFWSPYHRPDFLFWCAAHWFFKCFLLQDLITNSNKPSKRREHVLYSYWLSTYVTLWKAAVVLMASGNGYQTYLKQKNFFKTTGWETNFTYLDEDCWHFWNVGKLLPDYTEQ